MATRRYSVRDKLLTLSQTYTQKQIGKMLGVSERTIRRWKNEGVKPAEYLPRIRRTETKLQRSFEREHKRVAQEIRRDRRRHPGAPRIERKLRILPPGKRRELKVYRQGRDTGRVRQSEWINYYVGKLGLQEIFEIVRALRDEGRVVQLIYQIPKGGRYPRDSRGRPGRVVSKPTRTGSPPLDLSHLDDAALLDFLETYMPVKQGPKSLRVIYVSALDKKPRND